MEDIAEQELLDSQVRSPHNQEVASEDSVLIENNPPYFDFLKPLLSIPVEKVIQESRRYEKPYLAWQAVRHATGARNLTGFEGYFVGVDSAESMNAKLNEIGKYSIMKLSQDPILKQEVMNTLSEKNISLRAIKWLNAEHGSITARLRAQVSQTPKASNYRDSIYARFGLTSSISYKLEHDKTKQSYHIPVVSLPSEITKVPTPSQKIPITDPLYFLSMIGKVGHPLVRTSLQHIDE